MMLSLYLYVYMCGMYAYLFPKDDKLIFILLKGLLYNILIQLYVYSLYLHYSVKEKKI